MEYQQVYPDDRSYHSSQDGDFVYDSPDDYSDRDDSYNSSFIDDSQLDDDAYYFDDQENIYTKYLYIPNIQDIYYISCIFIHNILDILMMAIY